MQSASRYRHLALLLLAVLGGMALAMFSAGQLAEQRALRAESRQLRQQLDLYAQSLQQRIDRYRTLPQVLALDPELRAALTQPPDPATHQRLNLKLERANDVTRSSTLTLIGTDGVAVAASNWRLTSSNVGADYSFRPYVKQALAQGSGRFYGIGMTTGVPGYFLSQAIRDEAGRTLGVIVIKIELAALEREWLRVPDVVLVSDRHGVVFLSSRDAWRYRQLQPLSAHEREELLATRQYARQALLPTQRRSLETLDDGSQVVRIDVPAQRMPVLWQSMALPESGWRLHLLHDLGGSRAAGRAAALAAGGIWLALVFLGLLFQQRQRLARLRQRSRRELETLLQQHAQELRTAQDGIVQAAQRADTGLSRSLEHLPQGVVIIDAQLRLVAWNSRYLEIFRFPPDLIRIGRPIEDVFRYNARRGLLGPGPVEAAIQRRLDHLRSGRPHMRESEKDDGTVLEIRGNPLPDGGFVTSYADITSYKNAARELRSLADALEHRVAKRTRDLAEAKREAENASRYKTRFVASAVHDLLQPLNAARMFVSALRGRLPDADARQLADHVDNALVAQDAILNSLLDISRLEAGTLKTQVRDFALGPLLQALAHEFGIVAEDRGLRLDYVPTRAAVRSDETLLRRILQNFLSNALRYTPRGRVLLGCPRRRQPAHRSPRPGPRHPGGVAAGDLRGIPPPRRRRRAGSRRRAGPGDRGAHRPSARPSHRPAFAVGPRQRVHGHRAAGRCRRRGTAAAADRDGQRQRRRPDPARLPGLVHRRRPARVRGQPRAAGALGMPGGTGGRPRGRTGRGAAGSGAGAGAAGRAHGRARWPGPVRPAMRALERHAAGDPGHRRTGSGPARAGPGARLGIPVQAGARASAARADDADAAARLDLGRSRDALRASREVAARPRPCLGNWLEALHRPLPFGRNPDRASGRQRTKTPRHAQPNAGAGARCCASASFCACCARACARSRLTLSNCANDCACGVCSACSVGMAARRCAGSLLSPCTTKAVWPACSVAVGALSPT